MQQQGDVIIRAIREIPHDATLVEHRTRRIILAEGEATGHAHAIEQIEDCDLYERDGTLYLVVRNPVTLRHEEHHPQTIEPGSYQIGIVQEYDYLAQMVRPVVD